MADEHKNKSLNFEQTNNQLPFHYPLLLYKNKSESGINSKINKEEFYFIYNEYQKKNMKNKGCSLKIPKNSNSKTNKDIGLSFNRNYNKRKNNNEISNSLSIIKNYKTNIDSIEKVETSFFDKNYPHNKSINDKDTDINIPKGKLKKYSSYFNPYIPNLNLNIDNSNKISFPNKLFKKRNNSSINYKKENKNKSFIVKRNENNRLYSSKSFCTYNHNLKINTIDNNNYIQNYMNKETIYNKRMEKIDKFLKIMNKENQKIHHLSFNKSDVNEILKYKDKKKLKSIKNFKNIKESFLKGYDNNNMNYNNHKKYKFDNNNFPNNNLINNKSSTPKETNVRIKENRVKLNEQKIKYNQMNNSKICNLNINQILIFKQKG